MAPPQDKTSRILALVREKGVLRPRDLPALGIHPSNLAVLHKRGILSRSGRGLYTLPDGDWTEHHSLVETSRRVPGAVIGLSSALRFHGLTNEMPHRIWIFVSRKARKPKVDYPPLLVFRCEPDHLLEDILRPCLEGTEVCITNVPRTIADCFLHRRAVGLEVAIQALREAVQQRLCSPTDLAQVARKRRAWNTMRPYLEALLDYYPVNTIQNAWSEVAVIPFIPFIPVKNKRIIEQG